jgi:glycosyltransferase involved in cell wall biosynthesis
VLSWSLLEAMSAGCTIVASDTPPLKEAIIEGKTGRLVNFFDKQALANTVSELLADKTQADKLSENARQFAIKNYDLQSICLPKQLQWVQNL